MTGRIIGLYTSNSESITCHQKCTSPGTVSPCFIDLGVFILVELQPMNKTHQHLIDSFQSCYTEFEKSYLDEVAILIADTIGYPINALKAENTHRGLKYLSDIAEAVSSKEDGYFILRQKEYNDFGFIIAFEKHRKPWSLAELSEFTNKIAEIKLACIASSPKFQNQVMPLFGKVEHFGKQLQESLGGQIVSNKRNEARIIFESPEQISSNILEVFIDKSSRSKPKDLALGFTFILSSDRKIAFGPEILNYCCAYHTVRPIPNQFSISQMELLEHFDLYTGICSARNFFYSAEKSGFFNPRTLFN